MKLTLKALRVNYGLTQEEMAKEVGVGVKTWQSYENAKTFPSIKKIEIIQDKFDIEYDDIIFCPQLRFNRKEEPA